MYPIRIPLLFNKSTLMSTFTCTSCTSRIADIGRLKNYKAPETPTIERVDERTLRCTAASSLSHTFLFLLRDGAVDRSASNPLPLG